MVFEIILLWLTWVHAALRSNKSSSPLDFNLFQFINRHQFYRFLFSSELKRYKTGMKAETMNTMAVELRLNRFTVSKKCLLREKYRRADTYENEERSNSSTSNNQYWMVHNAKITRHVDATCQARYIINLLHGVPCWILDTIVPFQWQFGHGRGAVLRAINAVLFHLNWITFQHPILFLNNHDPFAIYVNTISENSIIGCSLYLFAMWLIWTTPKKKKKRYHRMEWMLISIDDNNRFCTCSNVNDD